MKIERTRSGEPFPKRFAAACKTVVSMGTTPEGGFAVEWRFETANEIYPSTMRQELMAALHEHGTSDSDFASAELIFGELVSNVIRHACGKVRVRLEWDAEFPTLWVQDEEHRFSDKFDLPKLDLPNDPLAESGRGLYIVKALAKDFQLIADADDGSAACATLPIRRRLG